MIVSDLFRPQKVSDLISNILYHVFTYHTVPHKDVQLLYIGINLKKKVFKEMEILSTLCSLFNSLYMY